MRCYDSLHARLLDDLGNQALCDSDSYLSDDSPDTVARKSLARSFYKKLCPDGNTRKADSAALKKFLAINESISREPFVFGASNESESCFWDYFRNEVAQALDQDSADQPFDVDFIRGSMNLGPGANQQADATSVISKLFHGKLTYTDDSVLRIYRAALSHTGLWAEAEMQRFQKYGVTRVEGGKLFFAPKNAEISRTCCTEATCNMLLQKAVGAFLEARLANHFGISLSAQPDLNRELTRIGSEDGKWDTSSDESYCTIDLASASDSISLSLTNEIIVNPFLKGVMMASRSAVAVLPDGSKIELNMVSTMGNGFTFPLQTIIFASAVRAVYSLMGIPIRRQDGKKNFGTFGDDIIVVRKAYDFVCRMLTKLGFSVNEGKSFSTGPFRESCGHDYFRGRNVRGVYVKSLETPQHVYSLINRLHRWSAYHGILLPKTMSLLMTWTKEILVPPSEADDSGIQVPFVATQPKLTSSYWFKYRCFKRRIRKVRPIEPDEKNPGYYDLGFACGVLSGVYRRRDVVLRTENDSAWKHDWAVSVSLRDAVGARARYQIVEKSIPYWDYVDTTKKVDNYQEDGPWRIGGDPDSYDSWKRTVMASLGR